MKTEAGIFFEIRARFDKTDENGETKKVTEMYVLKSSDFGDAYKKAMEEIAPFTSGTLDIVNMKIAVYSEVLLPDGGDKFYRAKCSFITLDERTNKEKKSNFHYLVRASNLEQARKRIDEYLSYSMADFIIAEVVETKAIDYLNDK